VMRGFAIGKTEFLEGMVLTEKDILLKFNHLPLGKFADWIMPVELYFKGKGDELSAKIDALFLSDSVYDNITSKELKGLKKITRNFAKVIKKRDVKKFDNLFSQFQEITDKYITNNWEVIND